MAGEQLNEISRFTVPQLKSLCKERGITGYSKLSKAALLQKLGPTDNANSSNCIASCVRKNATSNSTPQPSVEGPRPSRNGNDISPAPSTKTPRILDATNSSSCPNVPALPPVTAVTAPATCSPTPHTVLTPAPCSSAGTADTLLPLLLSSRALARDPSISQVPVQDSRDAFTAPSRKLASSSQKPANKKTLTLESSSNVRSEPMGPPSASGTTTAKRPRVSSNTLQRPTTKRKLNANVPSVQRQAASKLSLTAYNHTAPKPHPVVPDRATLIFPLTSAASAPRRYKRLEVKPKHAHIFTSEASQDTPILSPPSTSDYLSPVFPAVLPEFKPIKPTLSLAQRRVVHNWTTILSGLEPAGFLACSRVSKTIRYAVYLCAYTLLSRFYAGPRLNTVLAKHPSATTNFWPYLRLRRTEAAIAERTYRDAFLPAVLGRALPFTGRMARFEGGEEQARMCLRYLATRAWSSVSTGSAPDGELVADARLAGHGELWRVDLRAPDSAMRSVHVLAATCEVVGTAVAGGAGPTQVTDTLRADWVQFLDDGENTPLRERVAWTNHEEYEHGVSRLWLRRVRTEGTAGGEKLAIAERYVLAHVVDSGVSGVWRTTADMAADFAGRPERTAPALVRRSVTVNLFLPEQHLVESVHRSGPRGSVLHPGLAIVQTPARAYWVLRVNGLPVGCEDEGGVASSWQSLLGCDAAGLSR